MVILGWLVALIAALVHAQDRRPVLLGTASEIIIIHIVTSGAMTLGVLTSPDILYVTAPSPLV